MKRSLIILGMALCVVQGHAQNHQNKSLQQSAFDRFFQQAQKEFDDFAEQNESEFRAFRRKMMQEYTAFVENPWREMESTPPLPAPKDDQVPPVVMPRDDREKPQEDRPVVVDTVVLPPVVVPQPSPVVPIEEVPVPDAKTVAFSFFGTSAKVRFDVSERIVVNGLDEHSVAGALKTIKPEAYDNMILDCLTLRRQLNLSDWGYLMMLRALADHISGQGTNDSALLLAYLYMQSGYKMRLGTDGKKLYMLYASRHQIFNQASFGLKGDVYYGVEDLPTSLNISEAAFPNEQQLSLIIQGGQRFALNTSEPRTIVSDHYPAMKMNVMVNKNLIDFYSTYPTSMLGNNFMTRWAMYANTPLEQAEKEQIYPSLRELLKNTTQLEAVERILNLVQTGFVYEYDNKVWGRDRAFFVEESLYYPYCDCEDRAILFTRMVRDLLGLECILVYYPGHLASAVAFTNEVKGDYILLDNKKFTVCDPTYINASVGQTMPEMDNRSASVILLHK